MSTLERKSSFRQALDQTFALRYTEGIIEHDGSLEWSDICKGYERLERIHLDMLSS